MQKQFHFIFIFITFLCMLTSCTNKGYQESFKKIKVGDSITKVTKIMGEPDEEEIGVNNEYYIHYWFEGATSIKDAENKRQKGINVPYYCVIFFSSDHVNYKVVSKDDVISGIWGVK